MAQYVKRFFIHVDYMGGAFNRVRVQLKDEYGTRPGALVANNLHPARVYVKYYKNAKAGVRAFTRYRDELEYWIAERFVV